MSDFRSVTMRRARLIIAIAVILMATGACATVRPQVDEPAFQAENLPHRNLNIVVATDGGHSREKIAAVVSEASKSLARQVGVTLTITEFTDISWGDRDPVAMLNQLYAVLDGKEFDMAMGCTSKTPGELLISNLLGSWQAVIDDTYRRYIVIKHLDSYTLMHELGHAFIFSHAHSHAGLMQAAVINLVPGVPIGRVGYLAPKDREEFLQNKWRDFAERPILVKEDQEHEVVGLVSTEQNGQGR